MRPTPLARFALPFAALLLVAPGCDSAEEELQDHARVADDSEDAEAAPGEHHGKRHGKHGKHGKAKMLGHACDMLECTDAQREELASLMPKRHRKHDEADKQARHAEKQALHAELADAFRQDSLDTDALSDLASKMEARHAERRTDTIQAIVKGHAVLTADQRAKAVDLVDTFADKMGKGRHGKKGDGEGRMDKHVTRLCDAIACTDGQPEQIKAALKDSMPTLTDAEKQAAKAKIVAALQADSLSESDAAAIVDHFTAMRHAHKPEAMDLLSELHTILSAEQRETVAQLLETKGPRAIIGGKHGRHGKHGKKHRRGRKHRKGADELSGNEPQFG